MHTLKNRCHTLTWEAILLVARQYLIIIHKAIIVDSVWRFIKFIINYLCVITATCPLVRTYYSICQHNEEFRTAVIKMTSFCYDMLFNITKWNKLTCDCCRSRRWIRVSCISKEFHWFRWTSDRNNSNTRRRYVHHFACIIDLTEIHLFVPS